MSNQQLSDYINQQLQKGENKEEIKAELLKTGWQEVDINNALGISDPSQTPPQQQQPSSSVPLFTKTGMQQLDPKAVWRFFLNWLFQFLVIAWVGLSSFIAAFSFIGVIIVATVLGIIIAFIWAKLKYHFYRYELTEEGFRKEMGVISKKYVTIPYGRIQNVDIYRGLLPRILGLSDLSIQTAGMSTGGGSGISAEGVLLGVSKETAEKLRGELIRRSHQTKNQGL